LDFSEHLVISGAGSAAILAGGGGWEAAAAFSATGIFIDLDHFVDYWRETGLNRDLPRFMNYFSTRQPKHMLLLLHAWEFPLLAGVALFFAAEPLPWMAWGLAGWVLHLVLDHKYNRLHKFAYFFFFRLRHGFRSDVFYVD
jgi:hypothetical protein